MINYSFLAIGKAHESTEAVESKRYIGVGSSFIVAVNPNKKELESIYGHEIANEPEYTKKDGDVDTVRIDFIVKTDPEQCDGIEAINKATFFLRNEGAYNRDNTKMQVIDEYGNSSWGAVEDVKMNNILLQANGKEAKISHKYRPAFRGEADLVSFLKVYLGIEDVFNYIDGSWIMKEGNTDDYKIALEHIKDYFKGDVSELRDAIKLMPNNKVKLLYGVRTTDKGQFQEIATRDRLVLRNSAGSRGYMRLEKDLADMKSNGAYPNTEFKVAALQEYVTQATNLDTPAESASSEMPWD